MQKDKIEHKIVSYFILRKLARLLPLKLARTLTHFFMNSKEFLDKTTGLGTPEKEDIKANDRGIKEASEDIIKEKHYRYKVNTRRLMRDLFKYPRFKK